MIRIRIERILSSQQKVKCVCGVGGARGGGVLGKKKYT